jgi:hypothetical protein
MYMTMFDIAMAIYHSDLLEDEDDDETNEGDVLVEDLDFFEKAVNIICEANPKVDRKELAICALTAIIMWRMIDNVFAKHSVILYTFFCRSERPHDRETAIDDARNDGDVSDKLVGLCDQCREGYLNPLLSFEFDATDVITDLVALGFQADVDDDLCGLKPSEQLHSIIRLAVESRDFTKLNVPNAPWREFINDLKLPSWL